MATETEASSLDPGAGQGRASAVGWFSDSRLSTRTMSHDVKDEPVT